MSTCKCTLLGLEIIDTEDTPTTQMKLVAFLDMMRTEASLRLGIPQDMINAKMVSTPIQTEAGGVPSGHPKSVDRK